MWNPFQKRPPTSALLGGNLQDLATASRVATQFLNDWRAGKIAVVATLGFENGKVTLTTTLKG